ncbi:MAG: OB-fold domain-containing protein [Rhodocyclaceae bacterium]|nr:OB-fold domain-containing protein [Rhodocyclaceae bacterium]
MSHNPIRDEFRAGLARGELLVQKCNDCGGLNMYPRHACPHCQSSSLGWQKASGRGVLHSFTVLRMGAPIGFEADLPYALGVVKLEEGVQLLTRLVPDANGDWDSYACDVPVEYVPMSGDSIACQSAAWFRHTSSK